MLSRQEAWEKLCEWTKTDALRRHARAVEIVMRAAAYRYGEGEAEEAEMMEEHVLEPTNPYAATKAAVQGLTRVLAAELGEQKIRVNCLLPGAVFTEINQRAGLMDDETALQRLQGMSDLHALGRIGTTEEVAEAMAYLICAEWVTGAMIDIDGGLGLGITQDPAITNREEQ